MKQLVPLKLQRSSRCLPGASTVDQRPSSHSFSSEDYFSCMNCSHRICMMQFQEPEAGWMSPNKYGTKWTLCRNCFFTAVSKVIFSFGSSPLCTAPLRSYSNSCWTANAPRKKNTWLDAFYSHAVRYYHHLFSHMTKPYVLDNLSGSSGRALGLFSHT